MSYRNRNRATLKIIIKGRCVDTYYGNKFESRVIFDNMDDARQYAENMRQRLKSRGVKVS